MMLQGSRLLFILISLFLSTNVLAGEYIELSKSSVTGRLTPKFSANDEYNIACTNLSKGLKARLVEDDKSHQAVLVCFNQNDWELQCGKAQGISNKPCVWLSAKYDLYKRFPFNESDPNLKNLNDVPDSATSALLCTKCEYAREHPYKDIFDFNTELDRKLDVRCEGGNDLSKLESCGFDKIRRTVKGKGCLSKITATACKESMWRNLSHQERFDRIMRIGGNYAKARDIDPRALPCIATKESITLEPLAVAYLTCSRTATDQGLGQIVASSFQFIFESGFRSKIPPFDKPPYTQEWRKLFNAMALSAELQMEAMAAIMEWKLKAASGNYKRAFKYYNGGPHSTKYAEKINSCYTCLKSTIRTDGIPLSNKDPMECLDKALPKARQIFDNYRKECPVSTVATQTTPSSNGGSK